MAHTVSRRLLFASIGAAAIGLALTNRARRVAAEETVGMFLQVHEVGTAASVASEVAPREMTDQPGALAPRRRATADSGQAVPQRERRNGGAG